MRTNLQLIWLTALLVAVASPALALTPVASGVAARPLLVGNEVSTFTAPAVLLFQDGSNVKLATASRAPAKLP